MDVIVRLKNNKLGTDNYSKPTDTRQYLDHKSCHPSHVKKEEFFKEKYEDLRESATRKNYLMKFSDFQFKKAKGKGRDSPLSQGTKHGHLLGNKVASNFTLSSSVIRK